MGIEMKNSLVIIVIVVLIALSIMSAFATHVLLRQREVKQEEASNRFEELMGITVPVGLSLNRYYNDSKNGTCAMDYVFEEKDYDRVFQLLENDIVEKRGDIAIFQNNEIYRHNVNVFSIDEVPIFTRNYPLHLNWAQQDKHMQLIVGYEMFAKPRTGEEMGFTNWLICRDGQGKYHIMIEYM